MPKLYLIPNLLGSEGSIEQSIPSANLKVMESLRHFAVEHLKDSRRFLVKCGLKPIIDESEFAEINKHSSNEDFSEIHQWIKAGHSVGIISDAGCPGIADPGSKVVAWAHRHQIQVVPLVGPSSILLALIASGMNGQSFSFHGYLDKDQDKRRKQILSLQDQARNATQIFMETPYRNEALLQELNNTLHPNTLLCIATDISLPTEEIYTLPISVWKKRKVNLKKRPSIFLLGN